MNENDTAPSAPPVCVKPPVTDAGPGSKPPKLGVKVPSAKKSIARLTGEFTTSVVKLMPGAEKVPKPSSVNAKAEPFATVKGEVTPEIGVENAATPDRSPVPVPVAWPAPRFSVTPGAMFTPGAATLMAPGKVPIIGAACAAVPSARTAAPARRMFFMCVSKIERPSGRQLRVKPATVIAGSVPHGDEHSNYCDD